jgi:hypothetical protein
MSWVARTLWDLIGLGEKSSARTKRDGESARPSNGQGGAKPRATVARTKPQAVNGRKPTMQERYDALVIEMKRTYGVRVRKWRSSSSGCAWQVKYADGSEAKLIESPYPRGPMSCAIFLHEIGHHAIGFGTYRPRCLEEYHAWKWSLDEMRRRGLNVTPSVEKRMNESLRYAVQKALRRGMKRLPPELLAYAS